MSRFDNSKIKAMFGGKGFYIALALCLLAAGTIGYITLFSADSPAKEPDPVIEIKPTPVTPVPAAPTKPVIQSEPVEVPVQEAETVIEEPVELLPEVISPLDGTTVVIQHSGGYTTQYSSLQADVPVAEGQAVRAGDIIGRVGSTSAAESEMGPHLHFSVSQDGSVIDPHAYIED